jgi:hypothetical protein
MVANSVRQTIKELREERERLDAAIDSLENILRDLTRGDRAGVEGAVSGGAPRKRKNAPRGLLRKLMHEALRASGKSLPPAVLRDRVLKAGYPSSNPQVLYTAVYNAAKKDPDIRKTRDGFALKSGAARKK